MPIGRMSGFGLGLRPVYYGDIFETRPKVDWFEIITENFMIPGGRPLATLERIRRDYPIAMHGVSMSIASTAPLDLDYLHALKSLVDRFEPWSISDHLCWTGVRGINLHDLLPFPFTREALTHVVERIARVQDIVKRRLVIENISSYVRSPSSEMEEWTFLSELARRSGCGILLDVNNVFVSACNHGFMAETYIDALPIESIVQLHLAGHSDKGVMKIDTHDAPICEEVWTLYARAKRRFMSASTLIERDDNFPALSELMSELDRARRIESEILVLEQAS